MYDTTNITNSTNIYQMYQGVNALTDGYLTAVFLAALWLILFVAFKDKDTKSALLAINFIVLIATVLAWLAGLTSWVVLSFFTFFFVVSLVVKLYAGD